MTEELRPAWDAYVTSAEHGLPQHLSGWRDVLYKTYGYKTHYLMAQEGGRVTGVLPLFMLPGVLLGSMATTMPGGLCAESGAVALELVAGGQESARRARAQRFILHDTRQAWPGDLQTSSRHVHWTVDIRAQADALWAQLDSNVRRQVRMAQRNQLSVDVDRTGQRLGAFYDIFSRYTHQIGTPVFGYRFLQHIVETFPAGFNIAVVSQARRPIGAYFQLEMGRTVYGLWGATLREYFKLRPVYLAYWEILRDAVARGFHFVDMGRSPAGSNASRFKGQWGGVARPVYQQVACLTGPRPAEGSNGQAQWVKRLWPRLPLPVARYVGPRLRRHMPFG